MAIKNKVISKNCPTRDFVLPPEYLRYYNTASVNIEIDGHTTEIAATGPTSFPVVYDSLAELENALLDHDPWKYDFEIFKH